ncbi:MAG: peptidoglycan DD-metalloendopeptidase family protein [Flavobacteriaceae bacterium]|nr:peptidoglycan DD-metalloendopeptidase family protein [Muriicola sp.]NNC62580.1 peptidoglycan DD-metalloendopeptidase family protein [Eudoraea sp.]NNK20945.1 peptidoglycan DD-metalloendopeptidase family protein [Flavobacteriaceae bacterium]MBT8290351.1 peptidoglycan DD-metalloendopeptidase family protein [Muriicola sp.]NNK35547.1 peptidoglycan DD-metalloendopeptidase family protein [Eudoraea sp.]
MNTFFGQRLILLLAIWFLSGVPGIAQTNEQKALEAKREQLQKEITEMNRLLFAERKQRGTVLDQLELLDQKINVRQQLIRVTNQQSNLLSRQVNANIRNIAKLREDLDILKDEYANMIRKSYRNRSQQSRLMFLLSSSNFYQAYKRLQYLKQYTRYRKEQGVQIAEKTEDLITLNNDLTRQRREKESLIAENKAARKELFEEINEQKGLLKTIRQNESNYAVAINKKKAEARKIDEQIERLIRSAIAASNKKAGNSASSSRFVLTPEATIIANNFSANKGRLIWPVEKGIKRQGFGIYSDAVYPGIKHQNNGVIIATDKGAKARAVFEGEVIAIMAVPGGGKGVQVKHGNYISTYYNLANLYVKKGDRVNAKEELGEIYTNRLNGLTQLKFYLYRDATRLNPEEWIYQL